MLTYMPKTISVGPFAETTQAAWLSSGHLLATNGSRPDPVEALVTRCVR
jgi:hypothetical protein